MEGGLACLGYPDINIPAMADDLLEAVGRFCQHCNACQRDVQLLEGLAVSPGEAGGAMLCEGSAEGEPLHWVGVKAVRVIALTDPGTHCKEVAEIDGLSDFFFAQSLTLTASKDSSFLSVSWLELAH